MKARKGSQIVHAEAMETDEATPKDKEDPANKVGAEKKEEPPTHMLDNPARVVPAMEKLVSFPPDSRWQPLRANHPISGILVLKDTRPGEFPQNCSLTSFALTALDPAIHRCLWQSVNPGTWLWTRLPGKWFFPNPLFP